MHVTDTNNISYLTRPSRVPGLRMIISDSQTDLRIDFKASTGLQSSEAEQKIEDQSPKAKDNPYSHKIKRRRLDRIIQRQLNFPMIDSSLKLSLSRSSNSEMPYSDISLNTTQINRSHTHSKQIKWNLKRSSMIEWWRMFLDFEDLILDPLHL
jgi:hypothetical protein